MPQLNKVTIKVLEKFSRKFEIQDNGCWAWVGAPRNSKTTRGAFYHNYTTYLAYRFIYEVIHGKIPADMTLDHLCRDPSCVNPKHLEPTTQKENNRRHNSLQTHCKQGHMLNSPEWAMRVGRRYCNTCHMLSERKRREESRFAAIN